MWIGIWIFLNTTLFSECIKYSKLINYLGKRNESVTFITFYFWLAYLIIYLKGLAYFPTKVLLKIIYFDDCSFLYFGPWIRMYIRIYTHCKEETEMNGKLPYAYTCRQNHKSYKNMKKIKFYFYKRGCLCFFQKYFLCYTVLFYGS